MRILRDFREDFEDILKNFWESFEEISCKLQRNFGKFQKNFNKTLLEFQEAFENICLSNVYVDFGINCKKIFQRLKNFSESFDIILAVI